MKRNELKIMIRKIVREEVAMAIKEVITELREPVAEQQPQVKQPKKKKVAKEKQHFTSNSVLNEVLNETVNEEWETMGGGTFDSSQMNGVLKGQYADVVNGSSQPSVDVATSMGVDSNDPVNSFLTKDYSQTLKAMEKAAGKSRGNV